MPRAGCMSDMAAPLARRFALGLLGLLALAGAAPACAPADEEGAEASTLSDALTERDWNRAVRYLGNLTYLPWGYTEDGCYARAIYYSMNLAAEGVASNHVYIIAQPGYGLGSSGRWRYHVAPLVSRDATNELLVLDPVYDARAAIRLDRWATMQSRYAPGTEHAPDLRVAPGTSYGYVGSGELVRDVRNPDVDAFSEPDLARMPAFSMSNINSACHVMHSYIDREGSATKDAKHATLSRETRRLVTALASRGKLEGNAADLTSTCLAYAPEIASCPADDGTTNPGSRACCLASAHFCWSDATNKCHAPGDVSNGRTCGEGGNWETGTTPAPSGGACPADTPANDPGSRECCLASKHWCWSSSRQFCAAPGFSHTVDGVSWTCGANGEWSN